MTTTEADAPGRLERAWQARLDRISTTEHARLLAEGVEARPTLGHWLVLGMATLVHLGTVFVALLMVLVAQSAIPLLLKVPLCALLVGLVWQVGPRPHSEGPEGFELTPSSAPHLFQLVTEVAAKLGVQPPARILVDADVNAGWSTYGWWRHRALTLGLPLWAILDGQGKVALLGHELGHEASGDPARGWYVGSAIDALREWRYLLTPAHQEGSGLFALLVLAAQWLLVILMTPVLAVLGGLTFVLGTLALRTGQRAEHRADLIGAQLAGKAAAIEAEERLLLGESVDLTLSVALRKDQQADLWQTARDFAATVSPRERDRLWRHALQTLERVDDSHPPTARRLEVLAAAPDGSAQLVLSAAAEAAVDAEVRLAEGWVRRRVRDNLWE